MGLDLEAPYGCRAKDRTDVYLRAIRAGLAAIQAADCAEQASDAFDRAA